MAGTLISTGITLPRGVYRLVDGGRVHLAAQEGRISRDNNGDHTEAAKLASALGLYVIAGRYNARQELEDSFAHAKMSHEEQVLWSAYCPTRYTENAGGGSRAFSLYAYDTIPVEVLRFWQNLQENFFFDSFQIWTTESTSESDPLLVGVRGASLYLLARWGDDSPSLLSFAQVKKAVLDRVHAHRTRKNFFDSQSPGEKAYDTIAKTHLDSGRLVYMREHSHRGFFFTSFFNPKHCSSLTALYTLRDGSSTNELSAHYVCQKCGTVQQAPPVGGISAD